MNWFLDKPTIKVTKEIFDDKAVFLLGGKASEIYESEPLTELPFLTEVEVDTNESVYPFFEDMNMYEYDPLYLSKDTPTTVRFRGTDTKNIYTFFGLAIDDKNKYVLDLQKRGSTDGKYIKTQPIGKCVSTKLGIIIYDKDYTLINPLLMNNTDPKIFTKPDGPAAQVADVLSRTQPGGVIDNIKIRYFFAGSKTAGQIISSNSPAIPLFGSVLQGASAGVSFPAPKELTPEEVKAIAPTPELQVPVSETASTSQDTTSQESNVRGPKDRITERKQIA